MKICRFLHLKQEYYGEFKNNFFYPFPDNKIDLNFAPITSTLKFGLHEIKLQVPVVPSKIVCVGRNYAEHAAELGNDIPEKPLLFLKAPSALITEGDTIQIPAESKQVEHEGELGIVISQRCSNLNEEDDPFAYVLGYICLNDVTARDLQKIDVQFTRSKSFDTFCPVSAFIETDLEVTNIRVQTKVNGIVKQDGNTSQMVFQPDFLIRYISNQMTLLPGDIIATGTPSGVTVLKDGDICEVEIEGIGTLKNTVSSKL